MRFTIQLSFLLFALVSSAADYYVATTGSDSADGSLATPFLTLEKARNSASSGDTVYVRGGTYCLTNTFALGSTNGGVTYRQYLSEVPLLVGGLPITGWEVHSGSIYKADVSTQGFATNFVQLVCGNYRQTLARYPNNNGMTTNNFLLANQGGAGANSTTQIGYYGTLPNAPYPADLQVFAYNGYAGADTRTVDSIDTDTKVITASGSAVYHMNRFIIQNALAELDAPGEWYLDSTNKWVYFWPSNSPPTDVYAPLVTNIVTIGTGSTNITFQGFTLQCCDGAAIRLTTATNCLIAKNTIKNSGSSRLTGSYPESGIVVSGGQTNRIVGNDIAYSGSMGVWVYGTAAPLNHVVDNNYIRDAGIFRKDSYGSAIRVIDPSGDNVNSVTVSRNMVLDAARVGIYPWGINIAVVSNRLENTMLDSDDGGAVYISAFGAPGNTFTNTYVSGNYITNATGYGYSRGAGAYRVPYEGYGIYLDNPTLGVNVSNNIVTRCGGAGLFVHSGGNGNTYNNVFAYNQPLSGTPYWFNLGMRIVNLEDGLNISNIITRNIFVQTNGSDDCWLVDYTIPINNPTNTINTNVYHYTGIHGTDFFSANDTTRYTLSEWTAAYGFDANSITNDPLLNADFSLEESSPALALGITSLSTNNIGCYSDTLRATWPLGGSTPAAVVTTTINGQVTFGAGTIIR